MKFYNFGLVNCGGDIPNVNKPNRIFLFFICFVKCLVMTNSEVTLYVAVHTTIPNDASSLTARQDAILQEGLHVCKVSRSTDAPWPFILLETAMKTPVRVELSESLFDKSTT